LNKDPFLNKNLIQEVKREEEKMEKIKNNLIILGNKVNNFKISINEEDVEKKEYFIEHNFENKFYEIDIIKLEGSEYTDLSHMKSENKVLLDNEIVDSNDTIVDTAGIIPLIFYINCAFEISYKKINQILFLFLIYFIHFKFNYIITPSYLAANKLYNLISRYHSNKHELLLAKYICDLCCLYDFKLHKVFLFEDKTTVTTNYSSINILKEKIKIENNHYMEMFYEKM